MGAQVGILSGCQFASLDGLAYTGSGRNLKTWWDFEDFNFSSAPVDSAYAGIWQTSINGAGAAAWPSWGTAVRPGRYTLETGTTAAGRAAISCASAGLGWVFGAGQYTFETDVYIPVLSAIAEEFIIRIGFGDSGTADYADGAYFEYDRLVSQNWYACTADNSARTKNNLGVTVVAGSWIRLKLVVNPAGTLVSFYVNNVYILDNNTDIPTGATRYVGGSVYIIKSAGLTSRVLNLDWIWLHADLTASR